MSSIGIVNISKTFGRTAVLRSTSIEVHSGELLFLLGPSGCGKTTLLRIVAGFTAPDSGRVLQDGRDITALPPQKRHTAMVFQSYALWPHMTVLSNVQFGLGAQGILRKERKNRAIAALDAVQMNGYEKRRPSQLSGGQQQRVALARALAVRPKCLLLDEPLSNLDARLRIDMRLEIRRICKEFKLSAIYVTHDQDEALSMADRIAVMREGRVVQVGAPAEIYRTPIDGDTARFIGSANLIRGKVHSFERGLVIVSTSLGTVHASSDWKPEAGMSCTLCLRPEAIRLVNNGELINCFTGRASGAMYLGESTRLSIECNGMDLVGSYTERAKCRKVSVGDALSWHVDPDDVIIIRNDL